MLCVALPSAVIVNEPGLMLKTIKTYQVVRYSSIFGVDEIVFYNDGYTPRDKHIEASRLIEKIWRYLVTPPYLRRRIIPKDPDLKYIGITHPLRLEVFDVEKKPRIGGRRLGYIYRDRGRLYADIGLEKPFRIEAGECREGDIALVEITDPYTRRAVCVGDEKVYRGPILGFEESFRELIDYYRGRGYTLIATSRYGRIPSLGEIRELMSRDKILVLFGSPRYGLYDIASKNKLKLREVVDAVWNMVPDQRVKTIRTEEALIITLGILNMARYGAGH